MSDFQESEVRAIRQLLEARKKGTVIIVNGRPLDLSKVRKPMVSEDSKHVMYANPRLMLKDKTKPTYEQDPENGVEYEWLLKGSYERLSRKKDYRPVQMNEVDWDSKFCKLDANKNPYFNKETGETIDIVRSGELELFETRGEAAYMLKRYGADQYLNSIKGKAQRDLESNVQESRLPLSQNQFIEDPAWQPGTLGNISDPETWGGGAGKHI